MPKRSEDASHDRRTSIIAGETGDHFGIVHVSINTGVVELSGNLVDEEVTVEPSKLAQNLEGRYRAPQVDADEDLNHYGLKHCVKFIANDGVRTRPRVTCIQKKLARTLNTDSGTSASL